MLFSDPTPFSQIASGSNARWMPEWLNEYNRIEAWFAKNTQVWVPPVYSSVDVRHSPFKVAVIDTNLFSAGFNNLDEEAQQNAVAGFKLAWERRKLRVERILLLPERHTRNLFYFESLAVLKTMLETTGAEVRVGYWHHEGDEALSQVFDAQGWECVQREGNVLHLSDWVPDVIVLNNDLSAHVPEILQGISTPICPPVEAGWHGRLKSAHFALYRSVVEDFSESIGIDAWPLHSAFNVVDNVDFHNGTGIEALQDVVAELLQSLREEYKRRRILETPYVVIKPDAGTYGMGVMSVHDASEVGHLNRKQRNKMSVIKDGVHVHRVLIQEGIRSTEIWQDHVAESVLYMVDKEVVGRFYRVHPDRDAETSLNAPGMLCESVPLDKHNSEVYLHTIVARLALVAAAREIDALIVPVH